MSHISVIVPVYRAEYHLEAFHASVARTLEDITKDYEIIFIEDCGGDGSWGIIQRLGTVDNRVKGLRFSRNFGQHFGITAGLDHSDGDWVVVMDGDFQDPPSAIKTLYDEAQQGYDVVLARRVGRNDGALRNMQSAIFAWAFEMFTDLSYDSRVGPYRILTRRVVDAYRSFNEKTRLLGGAIEWLGFPTSFVDIVQAESRFYVSGYTAGARRRLAIDAIVAYSNKPLRLSVKIGFAITAVSIIAGLCLVINYFMGHRPIPGWTSIIVSIYFIGGIIIANLGILGIYAGKIYDETKNRPTYVVAEKIGGFKFARYDFTKE